MPAGDKIGAADLAIRVAERLREQRKRRDLSLDQLSQLTGVSRAALSQIETRKTNPTIGVLWKISAGLGVAFSDLIGEKQTGLSVLRRGETQLLRSLDGKFESRPLMPARGIPSSRCTSSDSRRGHATRPSRTDQERERSWWCSVGP